MIDGVAMFVVGFVVLQISSELSQAWQPRSEPVIWLGFIVYGLVAATYTIGLHAWKGRTLGKFLVGTIVLDKNELPIGFQHAFLRYLPFILPTLALIVDIPSEGSGLIRISAYSLTVGLSWIFSFVNSIWLLLDSDIRALHDYFGGTNVYYVK